MILADNFRLHNPAICVAQHSAMPRAHLLQPDATGAGRDATGAQAKVLKSLDVVFRLRCGVWEGHSVPQVEGGSE